nr:hypothetical protein [Lysinibacillus sphaericus]
MTIITSVYVPEGIVMAADSRLTGWIQNESGTDRFTLSDNSQKLMLVRESTVGVSFCGDAIIDGKTVADLIRVFDINLVNRADTVKQISSKLKDFLYNYYPESEVAFIVAGFDNDEPYVFTVDKMTCNRCNVVDTGELYSGAFWNGELLPVQKILEDTVINFDFMPLKDAVDLAEFIVELTIKYERFADKIPTCGGPIDILVITKDYTQFYRHKTLKP